MIGSWRAVALAMAMGCTGGGGDKTAAPSHTDSGSPPGPTDTSTPPDDSGQPPPDDTGPPSDDTGPHSCFDDPVQIDIGTGETTFEPLTVAEAVTMVHGPQGGWHILGSVRAHNTDPVITVHFTVTHAPTGATVADNTYRVAIVTDGDCSGYFPGMYGYLDVSDIVSGELDTPPELMAHDTLTMTMEVTDYSGRTATQTLQVTAAPDPADVEDTGER
jgi:hypothetical protein